MSPNTKMSYLDFDDFVSITFQTINSNVFTNIALMWIAIYLYRISKSFIAIEKSSYERWRIKVQNMRHKLDNDKFKFQYKFNKSPEKPNE